MFLLHKTVKPLSSNIQWFAHLWKPIRQQSFGCLSAQLVLKSQTQINLVFKRNFFYRTVFWWMYPSDHKLRKKDGVAPHYKMIYKGDAWRYVKYGYCFITLTLGFGAVVIPLQVYLTHAISDFLVKEPYQLGVVVTFMALTWLGVHVASADYVYRMYYSEEDKKFLVVVMDKHPFAEKNIELAPNCLVPHKPSFINKVNPWKKLCFETPEKKSLFIRYENFESMEYYNKLIKVHHSLIT